MKLMRIMEFDLKCVHKTGRSPMAQDHFQTPLDPKRSIKIQKIPKIISVVGVALEYFASVQFGSIQTALVKLRRLDKCGR